MTYTDYTTLLAERDDLKARLAEAEQLREQILNFPNLRAMREAMVAAADENKELLAKLAERDAEIAKNGRHAMRVTISQLEARLAEKDETISRMQGLLETCDEVMVATEARLAEAERDAERYRWLRVRINFRDQLVRSEDGHGPSTKWRAWVHDDYRENPPVSEHIDEYIDAARAGGAGEGSRE